MQPKFEEDIVFKETHVHSLGHVSGSCGRHWGVVDLLLGWEGLSWKWSLTWRWGSVRHGLEVGGPPSGCGCCLRCLGFLPHAQEVESCIGADVLLTVRLGITNLKWLELGIRIRYWHRLLILSLWYPGCLLPEHFSVLFYCCTVDQQVRISPGKCSLKLETIEMHGGGVKKAKKTAYALEDCFIQKLVEDIFTLRESDKVR